MGELVTKTGTLELVRTTTRVVLDDGQWRTEAIAAGLPAPAADLTLGMFRAARHGEFAVVDPTLENLLQRPAVSARTAIQHVVATRTKDESRR